MSPRFIPASSDWTYADPALEIVLTFGENMFDGVAPAPESFVLLVDDVPITPDSASWDSVTELSLKYSEATLGPTVIRTRFSAFDPNFKSDPSEELVTPFDILVTAP